MPPVNYKRLHTFLRVPNRSQIILYLIIIMANLCFYLCVMKLLHQEVERSIILSIFTIFSVLMIFGGITTGQIDPTDQVTIKYLEDKKNFNQFLLQNQKRFDITDIRQCILCDAKCKKCSLHCNDCKRCIMFFITVCLTWGFLSMYIFSMAFVTYKLKNVQEELFQSVQFIIGWITVFIALITWILITALLVFHCYLIKNNMTTIQFIKKDLNIGRKPNQVQKKQSKVEEQNHNKINQHEQINNDPLKLFIKNIQEQPTNKIFINQNQTPSKVKEVFQNAFKSNQVTIKFNNTFSNKVSQENPDRQSFNQIKNNKTIKIQEIDSVKIQIRQLVQGEIKKQDSQEYQESKKVNKMIKTTQKIFKSRPFKYMIGTDILEEKIINEYKQKINGKENISSSNSETQISKSNST